MGDFNIILPTLIQQLKSILDQYQDDGQILKELIQNAEDASARTVKFLLDERSFKTEHLHHPELSKFQGPALYAYNDAVFTEKDWISLSKWGDSVKKDDPTKVGRFGLGFKSVFHMTDLPMIMSGHKVCAIDPHEHYFTKDGNKRSGYMWHTKDNADVILATKDQFEPLKNIFEENTGPLESKNGFEGTLFRFPLRQDPSKLCDNTYSSDKVRTLFTAFQMAAEQMLVFLMSVECIELYVREASAENPTLVFRINVQPQIAPDLYQERRKFLRSVQSIARREADAEDVHNEEGSLTAVLTLEQFTLGVSASDSHASSTYLVSHYCGWASSGEFNRPTVLSEKLSYLPWASTAAMLLPSSDAEPLDWMEPPPKPRGQLFCFLPLPLQSDSPTGLPVHVNGFFALSSSRHEVKWPSIYDSGTSDDACQWNKYMLENVVPKAYANMILKLIQKVASVSPSSSDALENTTRHVAYSLFPDPDAVLDRWQGMLNRFYGLIFKDSVAFVHTENGGKWAQPRMTVIPDPDEDWRIRDATARCLAAAALPDVTGVASVPLHVLKAIQQHVSPAPSRLTPAVLRNALRRAPCAMNNMSDDDRLAILEFILKADDRSYQELIGLPLIPLMNGSFTSFANDVESKRVYLDSAEHPHSLLPRSSSLFVDLSDKITDTLKKMLTAVADSKKTNLCHFNENYFKTLCHSMVNSEDVRQRHYGETLWKYLHQHFAQSLAEFEGLPFLLSRGERLFSGYTSQQLRRDVPVLTAECDEHRLNKNTCNALRRMGVKVVSKIASFIWSHEAVRCIYVFPPSPMGILEVLCILKKEGRLQPNSCAHLTASEKTALREKLDMLDHRKHYTAMQIDLLKSLPLFEVRGQRGVYASVSEVSEAAPLLGHPPLPPNCKLLDMKASSTVLIPILGIRRIGRVELFVKHLKPSIERPAFSRDYIDRVMIEVLQNLAGYEEESSSFTRQLSSLQFVSRQDGKIVTPSNAFDPHDPLLQEILLGQKLYPSPPYNDKTVIKALRRLGLVTVKSMTDEQLLQCAHNVRALCEAHRLKHMDIITRKSMGILQFLNNHTDRIGKKTFEYLSACNWLIPLPTPPEGYPSALPWFGLNQDPISPANVFDIRYAAIVGSCSALLPYSVNSSLMVKFGWDKPPPAEAVLRHLQNAIDVYRSSEKAAFLPIVCNAYEILQNLNDKELQHSLSRSTMTQWIWHGEGFAQPGNMVLEIGDIDCKPYIHVVPNETKKFQNFFKRIGVHQQWNHNLLLDVLHMIKEQHTSGAPRMGDQARRSDHQLSVKIVQKLAASWNSLPADAKERLIIPTAMDELTLLPVEACTYSSSNWLSDQHAHAMADEETPVNFVHPDIGAALAEKLGVPSLASRMIDPDYFEIGEGFGQSESLTTRLNGLLQDYADGLAVPKELIQNADDAGATDVKFIYDERCNTDCQTRLIDDGMRECQGPALWVFNNAVFSDQDFQDIARISNPQKANRSEQIGGFGLGFNSVYNLTDVPSILSRETLVIFDPHKYHLGRSLHGSNQPGIILNFQKKKRVLQIYRDQFLPYDGICGCNIMSWLDEVPHFNGTLFRLPLRTPSQASKSEISSKQYDKKEVALLFKMLGEACRTVLLFTQNVITVSVLHIPVNGNPRKPNMLFKVTKKLVKIVRKLEQPVPLSQVTCVLSETEQQLLQNANILRAAANARMNFAKRSQQLRQPISSMLVEMHYEKDEKSCQKCSLFLPHGDKTAWLVVCCMGKDEALTFSMEHQHLSPTGGVAAQVSLIGDGSRVQPIKLINESKELLGQIFCYLPLPIRSQLPVHINGAFALHSSRRGLITASGDDKHNVSALWNKYLMEDAIAKAYIILLEDLRDMHRQSSTALEVEKDRTDRNTSDSYHKLWPIPAKVSADCKPLVSSFYCMLADDGASANVYPASLNLFSDGCKWVTLSRSFVLDGEMRSKRPIAEAATNALKAFLEERYPLGNVAVVDIPPEIRNGFVSIKRDRLLEQQTYGKLELFSTILSTITRLPSDIRDTLILFALDSASENEELKKLLVGKPCIPVTPDGKTLKRIDQLVNPKSRIACLYSPDEGRFPFGDKTYNVDRRLLMLAELGMINHELTEKELHERASKSLSLYDSDDEQARTSALRRASTLLSLIEEKLENKRQSLNSIKGELCDAKFLPYISTKSRHPCNWKGNEVSFKLLSPSELYLPVHKYLLCYVEPLLDEASLSIRGFAGAKTFLELDREVPIDAVLSQLDFVTNNRHELLKCHNEETKKIMISIYQFLQDNLEDAVENLNDASHVCYIIVDDAFIQPENVCLETMERKCAPYLYQLPLELKKFQTLFNRLGMNNTFTANNIASALEAMKEKHKDTVLDDQDMTVAVNIANLLFRKLQPTENGNFQGVIYLPDAHQILRPASDLSFDNCPWLARDEDDKEIHFVHAMIPYGVASKLGVKTIRESTLQQHHLGISFGQKEELVNRIARIMSAYPRSKEIFYELLQNADDSGATEVHFIKDCRNHPTEKVFGDSWKQLQGPSLCVYNDKSFTKRDLEGIQSLGTGSKSTDPLKTGQYGVGFNSVYHLTDVPSFLTNVEEIGEVLCILDPHCHYVPGATEAEPGRQYTGLEKLKKKFPDVFSCYLENLLDRREGTLFRFPLRTPEMANNSKLCSSQLSTKDLDHLLEIFKKEMLEVLLFVSNLTQIKISEVSHDGSSIQTTYVVQAKLSDEDVLKRKEFYEYVHQCSEGLKVHKLRLRDIEMRHVCYTVALEDSNKRTETWRVVQRIGFKNEGEISTSIEKAVASDELRLLPRGGVAGIISSTTSIHKPNQKKQVFCFLPLPLTTELPVHINGHFALDYESRRGIWLEDDGGGSRTDWNMTLLEEVIAPAYIDFLKDMRDKITADWRTSAQSFRLDRALQAYFQQYPSVPRERIKIWSRLSASLYRKIQEDQEELLPLVKRISNDKSKNSIDDLQWLPLLTDGSTTATFFDDTGDKAQPQIKEVLIRAGLRWIHDPMNICSFFEASDVKVHRITPEDVINFIRSEVCKHPVPLPCALEKTIFLKKSEVVWVALYCLKNTYAFWSSAEGLPLGLSQAKNVHTLTSNEPLFSSEYQNLLPDMADEFLHESLRGVFGRIPETVTDKPAATEENGSPKVVKPPAIFKNLSVSDLASRLHLALEEGYCCAGSDPVPWNHNSTMLPNPGWISMLWRYLSTQHDASTKEHSGSNEAKDSDTLCKMVECLSHWALVPAVKESSIALPQGSSRRMLEYESTHYLVSIQNCKAAVDFTSTASPLTDDKLVKEALSSLEVLKLDEKVFFAFDSSNKVTDWNNPGRSLVKKLVTNLANPADVLESVCFALKSIAGSQPKVLSKERRSILLEYFSKGLPTEESKKLKLVQTRLRLLPFYETQNGDFVSLDDRDGAILQADIPSEDFDIWSGSSQLLMLKRGCMPDKLAKFLNCQDLDVDMVYYDFIFPQFSRLSSNGRNAHLKHIREIWLPSLRSLQNDSKSTNLLDRLKALAILDNGDGILRRAGYFYDPDNELLSHLWNPDKFPPKDYQSPKWLSFLREIGLQKLPTNDDFIDLAQIVASQPKLRDMKELRKIAKTLIKQILKSETLNRTLLHNIRKIPFICRSDVTPILNRLGVSGDHTNSEPLLIKFDGSVSENKVNVYCSWSTAQFLPAWADPSLMASSQFKDYDKSLFKKFDEYRNFIVHELGILTAPSEEQIAGHINKLLRPPQDTPIFQIKELYEVMQAIYTELQRRSTLVMQNTFKSMPFILLQDTTGTPTFVRADQLVLKMPLLWQVRPYIMQAPQSLASFSALLNRLGAAEETTVELYASLLKTLHAKYKGRKLTKDDLTASHEAVRCLVAHVLSAEGATRLREMYLPSVNGCLYSSSDLVYNDHSAFAERLESSSFNEPYLVDLKMCKVERTDFDEAMRMIPHELRPRSLFNTVEEKLIEPVKDFGWQAIFAGPEPLQTLLQSELFLEGLWRLIWHEHIAHESRPSDHVRDKLVKALRSIEVRRSQKLVTYLTHNGRRMEGSDRPTDGFISRFGTGTEQERFIIYAEASGPISIVTNIKITEIIDRFSEGILQKSLLYLYPMLQCEPSNIEQLLDKLRITPRGSGREMSRHQSSV